MKQEIYVVNVKCNGCANTIKKALIEQNFNDIEIFFNEEDSHIKRKISFFGDKEKAKKVLGELGYPEFGTIEAKSLLKKAKSFVSCAVGKF